MQTTSSVSEVMLFIETHPELQPAVSGKVVNLFGGSFLFLPKTFSLSKTKKTKKRKLNENYEEKWECVFNKVWKNIDREVKEINEQLFKKVLSGLIKHVKTLHNETKLDDGILPCEILLTGANLPDHNLLISALTDNLKEDVTPYVSVLWSRSCGNVKNAVMSFVQQIIPVCSKSGRDSKEEDETDEEPSEDELMDGPTNKLRLLASQYNLSTLCAWHASQSKSKEKSQPVVIFLPDFESFLPSVLSEFILLLSAYSSQIPLVLIFGVATTPGAVYQSLPRNVLSQLVIQLFKSESSISFLNNIVEKILFSEKCPFRLGTKCTTFLTDIFLFHSFSVQGFVQGFKFCMMEHFYKKNHMALCCALDDVENEGMNLQDEDLENIRRVPSFQKHVENSSKEDRKLLLLDNDHTRKAVIELVKSTREQLNNFHVALKCLHILTQDLPSSPLGRHLREYYCKAISDDIKQLPEYKECFKMLHLQSRSELLGKISLIVEFLNINSLLDILSSDKNTMLDGVSSKLEEYKTKFDEIGSSQSKEDNSTEFESTRKSLLEYLQTNLLETLLKPPVLLPLQEIIIFDDLPAVRRRISGSPRSAIHLALNNPHYYLNCKCCELPHPEAVLPTLPDISVAYKLHLEFNKVINLYDWLQAFAACVKPEMSEAETELDEEIQARFTRAVSELQFLGFIKPSRSKAEYVTRLTWGNS